MEHFIRMFVTMYQKKIKAVWNLNAGDCLYCKFCSFKADETFLCFFTNQTLCIANIWLPSFLLFLFHFLPVWNIPFFFPSHPQEPTSFKAWFVPLLVQRMIFLHNVPKFTENPNQLIHCLMLFCKWLHISQSLFP